jgi:NADH pyrophosphatase NudC (nudix superfamily)
MDDLALWLTVAIAALLSLLAIYYTVSPLLQKGHAPPLLDDDKLVELLGRKDATLQAIKDLEFDHQVGKISEEDFQRLDARLRRQAIGLLQQIEKVAPASASLDEQLESIIAQFRQTAAPAPVVAASPAPVAVALPAQMVRFCTHCGKAVQPTHNFCAHCGAAVAQVDGAHV